MKVIIMATLLAASVAISAAHAQSQGMPDEAAIKAVLAQRIDAERRNVGIVVGVIEPAGQRIAAHGTFAVDDSRRVDGDTVF